MTLGEKLKSLREQKGWTQAQVANKLGVSSQVISNYERDYRSPDKEMLPLISNVFGCSLDWLLGATAREQIKSESEENLVVEKLKNRYRLEFDGREATDEEIEEAIRYIKALQLMKAEKKNQN
ncbi:helix-turn-helix domain-containing protein [Brevibacillus laterosporus]|uniref:helix-turn-helix domain-containing protein n=1 Tax=Brevibacillus laterosporus TaxID=1465 RepID=UPI000E6C1DB7|nr:helix-turn-helix transcriptional regulator [Brevibacillus laterosporus]AYB39712.1 XRE family transcriptional regulator [Brevibacillus laterosporus]MBM7109141.1 HTH-type transcriptional regulator ImmR [Brevibacillus laterosporus]